MPTSLGGAGNSPVILTCYFGEAASEGDPVELNVLESATATTTLDSVGDVVPCVLKMTAATKFFGVAKYDTPADKMGEVIIFGLARCTAGGTIDKSTEARIQFQTDLKCDAYASGDVHGVALEDGTDTNKIWVIVNNIGATASFGVEH